MCVRYIFEILSFVRKKNNAKAVYYKSDTRFKENTG